ncbi:MAG: adenylate/guanylate cyclase domain-containing protein [Actinomycetota bacterium]
MSDIQPAEPSEGLAELLLNSTGEGIYGVDLEGNCTFANPACVQLLGYDRADELLGKNMHNLVHHSLPNGQPYAMEDCRIFQAFRLGEGVRVDDEVLWRRDGSSFPAEYWSYPTEKDGELIGSVLTFVDITERRIAEMRLRESEERTRLLLNSTGEGIYGIDLEGNCTFANPACVRLLGYDSSDELLGRNMHNLVHYSLPNGQPYAMKDCRIYRAFRIGEGVRVDDEVLWRRDGSSFPAEYWSYPMEKDGELTGSVLTFIDITERRHMEATLRSERERAESLLLNVLPAAIAERLKSQPGRTLAERFDSVSVLFADLVGFTPLAARLSPEVGVDLLNDVFTAFDSLTVKHGVEKIKTIGDGYMVVGGAPQAVPDQCDTMTRLAVDMQKWMATRAERDGLGLKLRIGINCGPAVGAIVGTKKFQYDLWGDAVNVASRMESSGSPGRIQVTDVVRNHLGAGFDLEDRGEIDIKGKGRLRTWFVDTGVA